MRDEEKQADQRWELTENLLPRLDTLIGEFQTLQKTSPATQLCRMG